MMAHCASTRMASCIMVVISTVYPSHRRFLNIYIYIYIIVKEYENTFPRSSFGLE